MKQEFAGDTAYGWQAGDSDERDKGVIRLNGGAIQDININLGFGQSNSTCNITVVEEETGIFQEPNMGAPVRVAIPNSTGGDPDLFDEYNEDYSLAFIGLVSAINNNESTGGKTKTVELTDTKELLANIPVMMSKVTSNANSLISSVPNTVYAYNKAKRDNKGLKISAIWDAVKGELFHFYGHSYYIDMSYMFRYRSVDVVSNGSFFGSIDNTGTANFKERYDNGVKYINALSSDFGQGFLLGDGGRDDTWGFENYFDDDASADNEQKLCSENFRIQGDSANLLEIIDEAMTKNGCDWYVRANSFLEYSFECKVVSGPVILEIIPIQRNSFNQFTKAEFDKFVGRLYGVESSKTFGKELANQISNKIIFGSKWETMQRANVKEEFEQFWGYKKDVTNIRNTNRTIVDSYGNEIRAVSAFNENPTFDATSLDFLSESFYEFDLDDRFQKYLFYLLTNLYDDRDKFLSLMLCLYFFVKQYESFGVKLDGSSSVPLVYGSAFHWTNEYRDFSNTVYNSSSYVDNLESTFTIDNGLILNINTTLDMSSAIIDESETSAGISFICKDLSFFENADISDPDNIQFDGITSSVGEYFAYNPKFLYLVNNKPKFEYSYKGSPTATTSYNKETNALINTDIWNKDEFSDGLWKIDSIGSFHIAKFVLNDGVVEISDVSFNELHKYHAFAINDSEFENDVDSSVEKIKLSPLYKWGQEIEIDKIAEDIAVDNNHANKSFNLLRSDLNIDRTLLNFDNDNFEGNEISQRIDKIHKMASSYIDEHVDKKFYKKIDVDSKWLPVDEVWDGFDGYVIPNKFVRGNFMNKSNGKMPCLYRIEDSKSVSFKENGKNVLFVTDEFDPNNEDVDVYGRASTDVFAVDRNMDSEEEERYIVVTMEDVPERKNKNPYILEEEYRSSVETSREIEDTADLLLAETGESIVECFLIRTLGDNLVNDIYMLGNLVRPTLRVKPDYFFIPTVHSYARYGPWILDSNSVVSNRSKYGITKIETDDLLNPWQFRSYGEVQNYVLDQNKNTLMTEYILNRGQVAAADIPRFNIGHRIGGFSNISSVGINYSAGGVKTTYTLTAFGVGEYTKEQRDKQLYLDKIKNLENRLEDLSGKVY